MKIKIRILLLLFVAVAAPAGAASPALRADSLTASEVFTEIPLQVLDMLRKSTRLDMLDYYNQADSLITVQNALDGASRLDTISPDYLRVRVTPVSTLEIKILPMGKRRTIMTLYTIGGDGVAEDTRIEFFDSEMRPLPIGKFLKEPSPESFFALKGSSVKVADLQEMMPVRTIRYSTGPGDTPLTATLTSLELLPLEIRDRLKPLLSPSRSAEWKGKFSF